MDMNILKWRIQIWSYTDPEKYFFNSTDHAEAVLTRTQYKNFLKDGSLDQV